MDEKTLRQLLPLLRFLGGVGVTFAVAAWMNTLEVERGVGLALAFVSGVLFMYLGTLWVRFLQRRVGHRDSPPPPHDQPQAGPPTSRRRRRPR